VFFAYTAWSVVLVLVMVPLGVLALLRLSLPVSFGEDPLATTALLAQVLVADWSGRRAMDAGAQGAPPVGRDRWDLPRVGRVPADGMLWAVAGLSAIVAALVLTGADLRLLVVSAISLQVSLVIRWRWEVGAGSAVVLAVLALLLGAAPPVATTMLGLVLAAVLTVRMSLWLAAMVRELDAAREAQAQLAVAEERLRFARDLHDVTGRDLSVIAVKSELVAQLAEREDPRAVEHGRDLAAAPGRALPVSAVTAELVANLAERAAPPAVEHGREVAQLARTSLAEIRALVRGYREADLATELQGTSSLLRSAHADVAIH